MILRASLSATRQSRKVLQQQFIARYDERVRALQLLHSRHTTTTPLLHLVTIDFCRSNRRIPKVSYLSGGQPSDRTRMSPMNSQQLFQFFSKQWKNFGSPEIGSFC
jgi:hypothetical protein